MRLRARVDRNHADIVDALRSVGCFAQSLAALGKGVPDVLVWTPYRQRWVLLEIKSGPRERLTPDEEEWISAAGGPVGVVRTTAEALAAVGVTVNQ
jgi:hypothetical protein